MTKQQKHSHIDPAIAAVFEKYPIAIRQDLLKIRDLILETAPQDPHVGTIVETLKWGQISFMTQKPQSGTTIRLGVSKLNDQAAAVFVHCQTPLIAHFRQLFSDTFEFEGTRALICTNNAPLPEAELRECILLALRYHIDKKTGKYSENI